MTAELLTGRPAPEFSGLRGWLNSPTLTMTGLKGKVVLLDFWTYSCVNCIRTLPHMKLLHQKYSGQGLVLVGVHTPEFEFEKLPENVASAMKRFGIKYPVAIDSDNVTWKLYGNQYWPRQTLIDSTGMVRWEHAGEGDYDKMEEQIMRLLGETRKVSIPNSRKAESQLEGETGTAKYPGGQNLSRDIRGCTEVSGVRERPGMRSRKLRPVHRPGRTLPGRPLLERGLDADP